MKRVILIFWQLLVAFLLFSIATTKAQETDYRTIFSDAEYYFLFNDFAEALPLYQKALEQKPDNANLQYRIGLCYLNTPGEKHKAIPYLEQAVQNITPTYLEGSYKETKAPKNAYFYLGEAYRVVENIDKAIGAYSTFRELIDTKDVYSLDYVDQQIEACKRAIKMMEQPLKIDLEQVKLFDTDKYIFCQVVSADEQTMAFTTKEKFYDAIYVSRKKSDGTWGPPINISLDLNAEGEVFTTSLSPDGNTLYLFKNDRGIGNVYRSTFQNGKWQPAVKLGKTITSRNWETSASTSPDGQTLFFSSNRKGGYGSLDIYYSKLLPNGEWGEPQNIGPTINTPYNEESPFLSRDGNTLYFISQGHSSIGGYDIFFSEKIGDNQWSAPVNLGYPINTTDDDMSFFPLDNNSALVTMVQKDNPGIRNLYLMSIKDPHQMAVNVEGILQLGDNMEVQADKFLLRLLDFETNEIIHETKPEESDGKFFFEVTPGSYRLVATGEGYSKKEIPILIPGSFQQPSYSIEIQMVPDKVASGDVLVIRSILFEFDCDKLNRDAIFELEKVYGLMNKHPSLAIEVSGHTDSKGSAYYNYQLSLRRAKSVIDFLATRGIDRERMLVRGASDFEEVATNVNPDGTDNPEGRSLNRRAAISVYKSNGGVEIQEDIHVPEHLKPRQQSYTILLAPINYSISKELETKVTEYFGQKTRKLEGVKGQFAHTIGTFEHKSQAIELLNYAIDAGCITSALVGENDLKSMLNLPPQIITKMARNNEGIYTIQVLVSNEPIEDFAVFKGLNVTEEKIGSGSYQYLFGEFKGEKAAKEELGKIQKLGFPGALVMSVTRYKE